jgi:aminoglycoside phosphotransferase (APT) family kinase protein
MTLSNKADEKVTAWIQEHLGGKVVRLARQRRWREAWDVDVRTADGLRQLYVRGSKGRNYFGPVTLQQEAQLHDILERFGVPIPHVLGLIDEPLAAVMERVPGQINLATAESDAAREAIRGQYVQALVRLHAIPNSEFAAIGLPVPTGAREIAMNLYGRCERIYQDRMRGRPFALMDFIWNWLNRHIPEHRNRAAFVTADSGQFLFEGDRLTSLIDLEVGYVGDPAAEFAGMRLRDTTEPLGDIPALVDHYGRLTGDSIDNPTIEFHTAGFNAVNGFLLWPMAFETAPGQDYVAYLSFAVGTSRWAIEAMAQHRGFRLEATESPTARAIAPAPASQYLLECLAEIKGQDEIGSVQLERALCLARYLDRWNAYGSSILRRNLEDVGELLGRRYDDIESAEADLVKFVRAADASKDARLARYFHRWLERYDFLLRDCGSSSWLVGMHLQRLRYE